MRHVYRFVIIFLCGAIFASCSLPSYLAKQPIGEVSIKSCPHAELLSYSPTKYQNKIIYIILQAKPLNQQHELVYKDIISKTLQSVVNPGDKIIMAWMEKRPEQSIFISSEAPTLEPLIVPKFDITELELLPTTEINGSYVQSRLLEKTATAVAEYNYYLSEGRNCEIYAYNSKLLSLTHEWNKNNNENIMNFTNGIVKDLIHQNSDEITSRTQIFEAVSYGLSVLKDRTNTNANFKFLIIFSDMVEVRSLRPQELFWDTSNVDVIIPLYRCQYSFSCDDTIEFWKAQFSNDNASSITFLVSEDNIEKSLVEILGRQ